MTAPPTSYQQLHRGIDQDRLKLLQEEPPSSPILAVTPLVRAHSQAFGCPELLVWEQVNHGQELYIPPGDRYDVYVRLAASNAVVQWREGVLDVRQHPVGEIVVAPPYQAMYFRTFGPGLNLHMSVLPELLMRASGSDRLEPRTRLRNCFGERDETVLHIGRVLQQYIRAPGTRSRAFLQSMGMALAIQLLERFGQRCSDKLEALSVSELARVDDFVHAHLHERITLEQLANVAALSPHAFYRAFKAVRATPPLRYVLNERMRRAHAQILGTRRPIGDIATDVGFTDLAHFSNTFRKHWGLAPTRLRGRQALSRG